MANSLGAALRAISSGKPDPFGSRVTWDLSWLHLLADIKYVACLVYFAQADHGVLCRLMEVVCGREGSEAAEEASKLAVTWASTSRARRAVLHAVSILETANSMGLGGREVPPMVSNFLVTQHFS